jgi:lipopolysaccharide export system protein LptA
VTTGQEGGIKAAQPGPGGSSQIKRLEANGDVLVTRRIRPPPATKGVFDMKTNTITLIGNVVVSQGRDVLRGERLVVDRDTGVLAMEGGRVRGYSSAVQGRGITGDQIAGDELSVNFCLN